MSTISQREGATAGTAVALGVHSEVGRLRRVVLHRPDLELRRLTPSNKDELLFDDVLWVKRARQEHDAFADALARARRRGPLPRQLLADVLEIAAARDEVLDAHDRDRSTLGPELRPELREWLAAPRHR